MSNVTSTFRSSAATATTPKIYNVITSITPGTESSQALSTNAKRFMIRVRGNAKLQVAFNVGESGTNYATVRTGTNYCESDLEFNGTLYFQANKASQVVEIIEWS